MNNKLLIGVLIAVLFVIILIVPYIKNQEDFTTIYRYPNTLMMTHNDFINSKSNQYSNIFNLFGKIANDVYSEYREDENKQITANIIKQEIFYKVFDEFLDVRGSPICNINNKNEACKFYVIVLQYLYNNTVFRGTLDATVVTRYETTENYSILELDPSDDTDIKNVLSFDKITVTLNKLFENYITPGINNFTNMRKEVIIKKLVKNILFNIYFTIYPSSVGGLACPLYTADTCPSVPYQPEEDDENSPTLPAELVNKYKCKIDKSFNDVNSNASNLCINNSNNKYITPHCEVMNGYGKEMCENTEHENDNGEVNPCKYENMTGRCVNSDVSDENYLNTTVNSDGEYQVKSDFTGDKCHLIYHSDLDEMNSICSSQGDMCQFETITDANNKNYGVCMAQNPSQRPENFCLELSNIDRDFAEDKGCTIIQKNGFFYSTDDPATNNQHAETNLQCHFFDESNEKIVPGSSYPTEKLDNDKAYVKGASNQKRLCEGLITDLGENKCQYIEYQKYIPSDHNSKYAKIGMCIPKNSVNLVAPLINNENDCHSDFHWSEPNEVCIDVNSKCDAFKHKSVCNLYDNCLWQSSEVETNSQSNSGREFEYGYCRDISSSLKRVEDLMDNIHQSHLQQAVELTTLEDSVAKLVPKFKNILTSN